eukprot:TRINITY_DN1935_c2_g1_i3.p1 TRINITY_DN1935_c2_g1~~TRINITY_DN1935_c2_g1_i3.p1  ORF type:complete len:393 (+),score=81.97 TRINITY_DN1935_c2_g1_i3:94-1272(+)
MIHAPKFGGIYLLGEEDRDIELVGHLEQELDLMVQLRSEGGELDEMELDKCIEWKLVALFQRCYAMLSEYESQKTALAIKPMIDAKSTSDAYKSCSKVSRETVDKLIRRDAVKLKRRSEGVLRGQIPPEETATPSRTPTQPAPTSTATPGDSMPPPKKILSDSEVISKLAEFYAKANPNFELSKIKKIWNDNKSDPQDMYSRMLKKYGEDATACVAFLKDHPKVENMQPKAASKSAAKPAAKASAAAGTPARKGPGVVGGILGVIASPVARLFGGEQEEELPQAILPKGKDATWNEEEQRWVFPDDEEGEAERAAIAAACKGPPPPPPSGGAPKVGSSAQYVDPFNSGGATAAAPPPAPLPMPPIPGGFSSSLDNDDDEPAPPPVPSKEIVQ